LNILQHDIVDYWTQHWKWVHDSAITSKNESCLEHFDLMFMRS